MRSLITIALLAIIAASCAKKTNPVTPSTPNTPNNPNNPNNPKPVMPTNSRFIPNWQRDTLYGLCIDVNGDFIIDPVSGDYLKDSVITYSINDTSFVEYEGKRYYLWWNPLISTDTFINNDNSYGNCSISTTKDTTGVVNKYQVIAVPGKYWDDFYNTLAKQQQAIMGHNFSTKYKVFNSYYQHM